jgi:hypothetical protein
MLGKFQKSEREYTFMLILMILHFLVVLINHFESI